MKKSPALISTMGEETRRRARFSYDGLPELFSFMEHYTVGWIIFDC
jgi:hypothetical protein